MSYRVDVYRKDHLALASELQISDGYEYTLAKSTSIRIDAYKKIPLIQSGIGNLRVFSSAFTVAVMLSLKK
jgi:hypothetical protein